MRNFILKLLESLVLGVVGGAIFYRLSMPLPWVLGSLTAVMIWQGITKRTIVWPRNLRNGGFMILGTSFGLYFTMNTIKVIGPYVIPYIFATVILIAISILISIQITKWVNVDQATSVYGTIPGGLSEMVLASEAMKANPSLVAIFQTIRLLTVLFIVPGLIIYLFSSNASQVTIFENSPLQFGSIEYIWYVLPLIGGLLIKNKIPAGFVIAILNIFFIPLPTLPPFIIIAGQIAVGIAIGKNISFEDLKVGGKNCFIYASITIFLILFSFGLGYILTLMTNLDLKTAILSIAPGGLIEMGLTARSVDADPAIVSALQLTRIFIIVSLVPSYLKWFFSKNLIKLKKT